jgi:helix-turn-helix protein
MNPTNNMIKGAHAESLVKDQLRAHGIIAEHTSGIWGAGADFITALGKKLDVKYAESRLGEPTKKGQQNKFWSFNLHHHGVRQDNIDFFICTIIDEGRDPVFYIIPSKLAPGKTFRISERQRIKKTYHFFKGNWNLIIGYVPISCILDHLSLFKNTVQWVSDVYDLPKVPTVALRLRNYPKIKPDIPHIPDRFMTVKDVAKILEMKATPIYYFIDKRLLGITRIGKSIRITRVQLLTFISRAHEAA